MSDGIDDRIKAACAGARAIGRKVWNCNDGEWLRALAESETLNCTLILSATIADEEVGG